MGRVMIVDDDESMRVTLAMLFEKRGHEITTAASGEEAVEILNTDIFDVILTDLKMGMIGGIEVLKRAKENHPRTEVIILTAYGTIKTAVEAMKLGAFDYLAKPFEPDEGILAVNKALERKRLLEKVEQLQNEVRDKYRFENLVGESPAFQKVLESIKVVAPTDSTVLLLGETGTGKELVARAIHNLSHCRDNNFIAVNCGAVPPALLESELFGYTKGAFTGANKNKDGLFSAADGGTLFLDEITATSSEFQISLLRVIQEGEIRRVGDVKTEKVDIRLLVATNQDLQALVEDKKFREDLYHRLEVVPITLPPLRQRGEDMPLLMRHFLEIYSMKLKKEVPEIDPDVLVLFQNYHWPGNVRELEHTIERALIFCREKKLTVDDFTKIADSSSTNRLENTGDAKLSLHDLERRYILSVMEKYKGNQAQAARELEIGRSTLWRKLKEYKIVTQE